MVEKKSKLILKQAEVNNIQQKFYEIKNSKIIEKINKSKSSFFEKSIKLTKLLARKFFCIDQEKKRRFRLLESKMKDRTLLSF